MKIISKLLAAAGAAAILGGCQSMFIDAPFSAGLHRAEVNEIDMSDYFVARLAAGRNHLLRNRPTQAVTAFRQAAYHPAHSAQAFNGMAVAYAHLGREDLAARYFGMAIAAAPTDARFARNLAKLESAARPEPSRQSLAYRMHPAATSASAFSASRAQLGGGRIRVETASASLVRLSAKEVRVVHGPTGSNWTRSGAPTEVLVRTQLVGRQTAPDAAAPREIALADLMARTLVAAPRRAASIQTRLVAAPRPVASIQTRR